MNKQEIVFIQEQREENPLFDKLQRFANKLLVWNSNVNFYEMYPYSNDEGMIISKSTDQQYLNNKYINTRTKIPTETRLEIDNLPYEKAEQIIIQTGIQLQKENYHFAIFNCKNGRSPHLIIYDFDELETMSPFKKFMAQVLFWRKHMPFATFQYADTGIFHENHYVPLEFSNHWRHGNSFELVMEYIPYNSETYEQEINRRKIKAKIYKEEYLKCKA